MTHFDLYQLLNLEGLFIAYFIVTNMVYLWLGLLSITYMRKYTRERDISEIPPFYSAFTPPVSIIVPAHNEEDTIIASVRALSQLIYPDFEIIVVNDGSTDNTLDVLIQEFSLIPMPDPYNDLLKTQKVNIVYSSLGHYNLRVIDKVNGGKADALNAGLNLCDNELVCCVDADSFLQADSLIRLVQPFIENPDTIACGGSIRVINGCKTGGSALSEVDLPKNPLALLQVVEYLRAFLFGRMGWSPLNALLIISGAFSIFKREAVMAVGGYKTDTVGEDMELVVRLHAHYRLAGIPYSITFIPDPLCWTQVPEDLGTLRNQRTRWQRGLGESLWEHRNLLFHPKMGLVGWVALPFIIELGGYLFITFGFLFDLISRQTFYVFLLVSLGMGFLLSMNALLLEEMSFHLYTRISHMLKLLLAILFENLGYRQLTLVWRTIGFFQWLTRRGNWGQMKRVAMPASPD
jgi:cellulose synthase/poly-beta-1,6-N-acetylglucosamine synthase-like glycosyltransferase